MGEESFARLLRRYRRNARDAENGGSLSQKRLADLLSEASGIIYSRGAISDWERDKGHIHKDARHLLVSLIKVLRDAGGITTVAEANAWLAAGNYRQLDAGEREQIAVEWAVATGAGAGETGRSILSRRSCPRTPSSAALPP